MVESKNKIQEILATGLSEFKKTLSEPTTKENNWENLHDKDGDKIYIKQLDKLRLARIETEIDASPEEIIKFFKNIESRAAIAKNQDKNIKEWHVIEQVDEETAIYYQLVSMPVMLMSDREFVVASGVFRENETAYYIQKSLEHDSKPVNKKNVRGIMHQANFCLVPNGQKTKVTCAFFIDIDFNPPSMMVSKIQFKRLDFIKMVEKEIQKARK